MTLIVYKKLDYNLFNPLKFLKKYGILILNTRKGSENMNENKTNINWDIGIYVKPPSKPYK